MSEKMSQDEINLLVKSYNEQGEFKDEESNSFSNYIVNDSNKNKLYKPIDFRKPNKLQYDNLGALKQIHEQFAKMLSNYLTMFLRISIQADVIFESVEQLTYHQYVNTGTKNCLWGTFLTSNNESDSGRCFIQFDTAFCDFFIDRSFGGSADYQAYDDMEDSRMSDINKEISKTLFLNILKSYSQAWDTTNYVNFDISLYNIEDNIQNLNLGIINSEMILIIPIELSIYQKRDVNDEGEIKKSLFKIGIPYSVIEPVLDKINISNMLLSHRSNTENEDVKNSIQKMSNNVDVYVGETEVAFNDLVSLEEGDVIFFNKQKNDTYDVYVGGIKKYDALPYRINKSVCVQIVK